MYHIFLSIEFDIVMSISALSYEPMNQALMPIVLFVIINYITSTIVWAAFSSPGRCPVVYQFTHALPKLLPPFHIFSVFSQQGHFHYFLPP